MLIRLRGRNKKDKMKTSAKIDFFLHKSHSLRMKYAKSSFLPAIPLAGGDIQNLIPPYIRMVHNIVVKANPRTNQELIATICGSI